MTGLSYIVVMLPSMAVMILVLIALIKTLTHLTGLKLDDLLAEHLQETKPAKMEQAEHDSGLNGNAHTDNETQHEQHQESETHQQADSPPIKDEKHYSRILGLSGCVTFEDVKKRYRELAAQYHPDKVSHLGPKFKPLAEKEMQEINAAYAFFKTRYEAE